MTNTTTTRLGARAALAVLAACALLTSGCASAAAGAWQETGSAGSSRSDAYEAEEETLEVRHARAPLDEVEVDAQYSIDRYAEPGGDYDEEVQEMYTTPGAARGGSSPRVLSEWAEEPERATTPVDPGDRLIAQATPSPATGGRADGAGGSPTPTTAPTASDALAPGRQLLIYTAVLNLAVHHVEDQQNALQAIARAHGGFMARRSGSEMVIRVPAARFEEALAATEALGDVLGRTVDAEDVGEEFRDTQIRLRNLEAMRDRLEELLRRADNVEAALAVEQQLERVTTEIELLRGRLRSLEDRIAYSTITVYFRPRPTTQERVDEFQLPFRWLHRLGLPRLMEVR